MKVLDTELEGVRLLEPRVFSDERGEFFESWNQERLGASGLPITFVQDNVSLSSRGVLRGLHYQHPRSQGKLISVLRGEAFDVAVDIRLGSPTFGRWFGVHLSGQNRRQIYIPVGFAHGFQALADDTLLHYKCTDYYETSTEHSILWSDPDLAIEWPLPPILSSKDARGVGLRALPPSDLPGFAP